MSLIRTDELLGRVRLCRKCGEEWPLDAEFWYFASRDGSVIGNCRACWADRSRERHATRKAAA